MADDAIHTTRYALATPSGFSTRVSFRFDRRYGLHYKKETHDRSGVSTRNIAGFQEKAPFFPPSAIKRGASAAMRPDSDTDHLFSNQDRT